MKLMMSQGPAKDHLRHQLRTTSVPAAYPPCVTPFNNLSKTTIRDLRLETHHIGKFLLLRSATPADRMTAVMSIVEDENRDGLLLQLYHQEDETERKTNEILREGDVLIIKQPYFKLMSDGEYGIRTDHLSDVVRLQMGDERIPLACRSRLIRSQVTAVDWKLKGNDSVKKSDYHTASEW